MTVPAFPLEAPFRIDQVTQAPLLLGALFLGQVAVAFALHLLGAWQRPRPWLAFAALLLLLTLVFFTLASWGNSDTTRFSHYLQWEPERGPPELLWRLLRPLVLVLPYRMAAVHGLVAAGFAAAPLLLAWFWRVPSWGGWWSLLICCSPLLRGFLQNAHTRQSLATLLLLPLFLGVARLIPWRRGLTAATVLLSALSHNTFAWNLLIAASPLLLRLQALGTTLRLRRRHWPWLLPLAGLLLLGVRMGPHLLDRLQDYATDEYFNDYAVRKIVGRLQRAMAVGLILACLQRRLDPRRLLRCDLTQLLLGLGLLYGGIQASISHLWYPQITSRLADGVAFFLLITFVAWSHRHNAHWCVLPALYVTFQYWFEGRILPSATYPCGENDGFLCVPDRWPWQVRW